jgi:hypothetical protein
MWVKMYIMIKRNVKLNIYFTDQGENRPRSGGGGWKPSYSYVSKIYMGIYKNNTGPGRLHAVG